MRVLHAAMGRVSSSGMLNQMKMEQLAANELGIYWSVRLYRPEKLAIEELNIVSDIPELIVSAREKNTSWLSFRRSFYKWLVAQDEKYDVIILRYSVYDPFLFLYLFSKKKPVFLVHHTLEVEELSLSKFGVSSFKRIFESVIGFFNIRFASGIIGVTKEIAKYELTRARLIENNYFVYPNGYDTKPLDKLKNKITKTSVNLLFVSSFFHKWQGLDKLINEIKKSKLDFNLHVVGNVSEVDLESAKTDNRIVFHGHISIEEIQKLIALSDLGLSAFALERKGMKEACPLKVREYLSLGLPVYAGHKDVFSSSFNYFKSGPCDINMILNFANEMKNIEPEKVRLSAAPYIEKKQLLSDLFEWLNDRVI